MIRAIFTPIVESWLSSRFLPRGLGAPLGYLVAPSIPRRLRYLRFCDLDSLPLLPLLVAHAYFSCHRLTRMVSAYLRGGGSEVASRFLPASWQGGIPHPTMRCARMS